VKVQIVDPLDDRLEGYVKINPHVDLDAAYTWDGDNLTQVVLTGIGYTKTIVYDWTGTTLDSMTVTIT